MNLEGFVVVVVFDEVLDMVSNLIEDYCIGIVEIKRFCFCFIKNYMICSFVFYICDFIFQGIVGISFGILWYINWLERESIRLIFSYV